MLWCVLVTGTFATFTVEMTRNTLEIHLIIIISSLFCKGEVQISQETVPEMEDLSPVLFEDSPNSSPSCLPGSEDVNATGGAFEVFGKSVEEAVREMRFRIEQKTMLTASAGEEKTTDTVNETYSVSVHFAFTGVSVGVCRHYLLTVSHSSGSLIIIKVREVCMFYQLLIYEHSI